jgi:hypothetical protein
MSDLPRADSRASRRGVVLGLAAAASLLLPAVGRRVADDRRAEAFVRRVKRLLGPAGADDATIVSGLTTTELAVAVVTRATHPSAAAERLRDADLRRQIHSNIRLDFQEGFIEQHAGWWISRTESRAIELMRSTRCT